MCPFAHQKVNACGSFPLISACISDAGPHLLQNSDETPANKRLARVLIEKWSRPILVPKHSVTTDSLEEQQIMAARQMRLAATRPTEAWPVLPCRGDTQKTNPCSQAKMLITILLHCLAQEQQIDQNGRPVALKPGDPGFRWHAAIPEPASLDYVKRPESKAYVPSSGRQQGRDKPGRHTESLCIGVCNPQASLLNEHIQTPTRNS